MKPEKWREFKRRYPWLGGAAVAVLCLLFLVAAGAFYMANLHAVLKKEIRAGLVEVARQGVKILQTQIAGDENSLKSMATAIAGYRTLDEKRILRLVQEEAANNSFKRLAFVRPNGIAVMSDERIMDISQEDTFKASMQGQKALSNRFQDAADGKDIIVQTVPIFKKGKVVAVLAAARTLAEYAQMLSVSTFGGMGYNVIVRANGDRVINSTNQTAVQSLENIFENSTDIFWSKGTRPEQVRADMQAGKTFVVAVSTRQGGPLYASFAPVGINDWYMVSLVPARFVHATAARLLRLTLAYGVFGLILVAALFYYGVRMRQSGREALDRVAHRDPITGFDNWAKKSARAQELLQNNPAQAYAMVSLDVDRFQVITHLYGVQAGDDLLRRIARVLDSRLQEGEEFSRVDADRFQLLLKYTDDGQMRNRLQLMSEEITALPPGQKEPYSVMLSFGVYVIADRALPLAEMLNRSLMACYTVKNSVEVVAFFTEAMLEQINFEKKLEDGMARAFKQGELVARFLPVKDLQTGKIVHACARVFWNHPEYGVLPGYAFRAIFERTGVARQVDKFLLEESFKLLAKTADIEVVSVVLSPLHAYNPYYAAELKKTAQKYHVASGRLELDMALEIPGHKPHFFISLAQALKKEGFLVGVHRFGEGTGIFEFLSRVRTDWLKVWFGSAAAGHGYERESRLLASLPQLAQTLQTEIEMDGVQTQEQAQRLQKAGFKFISGPVNGPALSAEELLALLAKE